MTHDVQQVKKFWESHVNNELYTKHDRGSTEYFRQIEKRRYKYHYHLPELFRRIAEYGTSEKRLLEVGCGIGIDTLQLTKLGFAEVVGADLTETAVEVARQRARNENISNVKFISTNAEQLDLEDESFDVVYSFGVIHHTPRIEQAVAEIHRVLKPHGRAFIMIYHSFSLVDALHVLFRLPYESMEGRDAPVTDRFSKKEARQLFSHFEEVDIHTDYPFTYGMRAVSSVIPTSIQRWIGKSIGWHLMIEARKGGTPTP